MSSVAPARGRQARSDPSQTEGRDRNATPLDSTLLVATSVLVGLGMLMIYSASAPLHMNQLLPGHFSRHLGAIVLGLLTAFIALKLPLQFWERSSLWIWGFSVLLLIATVFAGTTVNGAQRWLEIPGLGFRFQPGEMAKFATILAVAHVLANRKSSAPPKLQQMAGPILLTLIPAALMLVQPDLGNAVLLTLMVGFLLFVSGAPIRLFALPAALGAAGIVLYSYLNPYALKRWIGFLDPWKTADAEGFQLVQSFIAFGQGGLFGVGLGDGRQKLFYLPEAHTDFILSVVAEELGLFGVLLVIGGFCALLVTGIRIAQRCGSRFDMLCAFGLTTLLTLPAAVNIAVVMGLVPTKGLTLPFLSYGRTSLLVCFCALGILLKLGIENATRGTGRAGNAKQRGILSS